MLSPYFWHTKRWEEDMDQEALFQTLGLDLKAFQKGDIAVNSPIDGQLIGYVQQTSSKEAQDQIQKSVVSFKNWRSVPAPKRGELIRLYGNQLRVHKEALGTLITLETGKILQEGLGEVQEMIDICDFAVGISRQLYGLTIASERPDHRMMEAWHPLGPVGVISPFNFPLAVWCWNFALAIVCGDPVLWKPSKKTPLTAMVATYLFDKAVKEFKDAPADLLQVMIGAREIGKVLVDSPDVPLISATGSTSMGREVNKGVAERFGRTILELSGNNAMILTPSTDLDLALRAITFSALGTTGQRCTSLRRLIVHESLYETVVKQLKNVYVQARVGNPLNFDTIMGPLIDQESFAAMQEALEKARSEGGKVFSGERTLEKEFPKAYYVRPALVEMEKQTDIARKETFAPILYIMPYQNFEDAIEMHNAVSQGLSSSIFTNDIHKAEVFISPRGSDCGIANVNIGTCGAEIGGAFGGEKETGGGSESGSDAWKNYMRRMTITVNYSHDMPLSQGIQFGVEEP